MPLTPIELSLVAEATRVIEQVPQGDPPRRITDTTVGCAVLCSDGRVFTGVNVFHFTGGPCAENTAVANAIAAGVGSAQNPGIGDGSKLTTIVAVANEGRGVISPCGRCRQLMIDYYPDIQVIVKDGEELRLAGVKELLPFAYVWRKFVVYAPPLVSKL